MITALKRQHGATTGGGAHQFQCGFHGIGAGRATELDLRFGGQCRWQQAEQILNKLIFHRCRQVERVQR
ncbi:hypothetical protein D3C71_2210330 [compost metagenome]